MFSFVFCIYVLKMCQMLQIYKNGLVIMKSELETGGGRAPKRKVAPCLWEDECRGKS